MADTLNPVQVEAHIRELVNRIANGIAVCNQRYTIFLEKDLAFDRAWAREFLAAEGPVKDREQIARLETLSERSERDVAEAAHRHADKLSRALSDELRAYQSIGASVRQAYANAGREN